ncbi:Leucinostatins biosynthesis cluster protein S [Paramyrothecium foliicola]|nr:Leucinostatins biosynthesis cluster protein S [Paramyrothecium foliicola]
MPPTESPFFNLPQATLAGDKNEPSFFSPPATHDLKTNWKTFEAQDMNKRSLFDVFTGSIPAIRQKEFLSQEECKMMAEVFRTHDIGIYDTDHVWPKVGCVGVAQTEYVHDKEEYFAQVNEAYSLQNRWKEELGIDIIERVAQSLRKASGMGVRLAREKERDYFAGVIRAIDTGIQIHADYAPYEGNGWEIGRIAAQMSWNILLNPIPGGDTIIYDRQWQAPRDDIEYRKKFPKYAYQPTMVEGRAFKVIRPTPGDLYWFNPRNFHEVRACDVAKNEEEQASPTRYTVSSFVGFLPAGNGEPDTIVLWS